MRQGEGQRVQEKGATTEEGGVSERHAARKLVRSELNNPFAITGYTNVANSGGKTSGMSLFMHLEANGGTLTDKGRCVFTNTGWEHEITLDFLAEQERRWGQKIEWIEFCVRHATFDELVKLESKWQKANDRLERIKKRRVADFKRKRASGELFKPNPVQEKAGAVARAEVYEQRCFASWQKASLIGVHDYKQVDRATASTDGKPFNDLLEVLMKFRMQILGLPGVLPNGAQRICTFMLKMRPAAQFMRRTWNVMPSEFEVRLGLRADESERVASAMASKGRECGQPRFPLDEAGIEKADVAAFWAKQPFGMSLKSYQGNCGGCYMKRRSALVDLIRQRFFDVEWWKGWEKKTGQRFRLERSYAGLEVASRTELSLLPPEDGDNGITCEGGYCSD